MPSLPEVTESFEANVAGYVAGLDLMIKAAEEAALANFGLIASMGAVQAASDAAARGASADAAAMAYLAEQAGNTARAETEAAAGTRAAGEAAAGAAGDTAALAAATKAEADAASAAAKDEYLLAMAERMRAAASDGATAATAKSTIGLGRWGITWNALHWIIAGGAELLAVTLPAAVAAGAGAFVMYQGVVEQVIPRLNAMYGATEATAAMIGKTSGDVLGLGHAFQTAQNAANPIAYELLGSYLNAARSHMVDLAGAGLTVSQALGELAARINVDLVAQGPQLSSLLSNMVQDLIELGQVFGNVGHAILNFAADMPGLAEVLLRIADAASRLILWISELPAPLITTFMIFEEMSRWGGGLVTVLGRLGLATSEVGGAFFSSERFIGIFSNVIKALPMLIATVISNVGSLVMGFGRFDGVLGKAGGGMRNFGADMTDAIAAIPAWQAALAALAIGGFVFLAYKALTARDATQQFTDSLQKMAEAASNANVIGVIVNNMAKLGNQEDQTAAAAKRLGTSQINLGQAVHDGIAPISATQQKLAELSDGMTQQERDLRNVTQGAELLGRTYGTTFAQSLGLADAAGVKLINGITGQGKAAQIARQQIANLVTGYKAMDQAGGILGNDMNVLAAQAGLQTTKVQQLNSAWDQFLSNATGLTGGFAGLTTDIGQINNAITTAGKKFTTFGGDVVSSTTAAALSMRSFSGVGAQVWQNYNAALQQAQQYTDSLRVAAASGAVTQKAFTQQIAYTAQQLLPYAKYSQAATSELSVLVQEAGGPATSNFKTLKEWVDKNTESSKQFMKQTALETGAMSDATKVAEAFASTLNSAVAAALQSATISSSGLTQQAKNLDSAWTTAQGHISGPVVSAFRSLVTSLTQVYGNTKTAISVADAYMRQQGATGAQIRQVNADIAQTVAWLSRIHSPPPVTITVNGQITASGQAAIAASGNPGYGHGGVGHAVQPGAQTGAQYAAAGVTLVGEMGPELVRFGGGEQVVPSWQTAGIMHGAGGGGEGTINLTSHNVVNVGGQRMQSQVVTQSLVYQRRNPSNNLSLRTR